MTSQLIVDVDLTLYSLAEFLTSHRWRPDLWAHALWRFDEREADNAIDRAWTTWEPSILTRIQFFTEWSLAHVNGKPLFLTANPLTPTKALTFEKAQGQTLSTYPHSKAVFLKQNPQLFSFPPGEKPRLSVGDRRTDSPIAKEFLHLPVTAPIHRLKGSAYTEALKEQLCFKTSRT